MTKKNISIGFRLRGNQTQKSFGSSTMLLLLNQARSRYHFRCNFNPNSIEMPLSKIKRFRFYAAHITRWWTMEQSCESTESGTATSLTTLVLRAMGRGGYITPSKLSSQVIKLYWLLVMVVIIIMGEQLHQIRQQIPPFWWNSPAMEKRTLFAVVGWK